MKNKCFLCVVALISVMTFMVGTSAAQPKETRITLYTYPLGSSLYVHSYTLGELINKHSSWLRVDIIGSANPIASLLAVAKFPESSIGCFSSVDLQSANRGSRPFPKPIPSMKAVASATIMGSLFAAKDPGIKTWADVKGKSIAVISPVAVGKHVVNACTERAGLKPDEYKFPVMGFAKALDSLRAGQVDVVLVCGPYSAKDGIFRPAPAGAELIATLDEHFLPVEAADIELARKRVPDLPVGCLKLPTGSCQGVKVEATGYNVATGFFSDAALDDEIVAEFMTIWYKYFDQIKATVPPFKGSSKDTMGTLLIDKSYYHPAALKFLEMKGIEIK